MVTAKKTSTPANGVTAKPKAVAKKSVTTSAPVPGVASKPAVKKTPAKKAAASPSTANATPVTIRPAVTPEQRHHYIEVAAFYVAQRRGFAPGNPVDDWAMAEQEVDRLIASGHFSS